MLLYNISDHKKMLDFLVLAKYKDFVQNVGFNNGIKLYFKNLSIKVSSYMSYVEP